MSQGLQVFDASGNIILDTSDRVGRILGVVDIIGGVNGSVTNAGFSGHEPFWIASPLASFATYSPEFTFNSVTNTLSWNWTISGGQNHKLVYGAY
jgi:hypothetical protein